MSDAEDTDWAQIEGLHRLLATLDPNPVAVLDHAVAVAMVEGPRAGLVHLAPLHDDERMTAHHRFHAVRTHLLEMAGDDGAARVAFRTAARPTTSIPEQRSLRARAADDIQR